MSDTESRFALARRVRRAGLELLSPRQRARLRHLYEAAAAPQMRATAAYAPDGEVFHLALPERVTFRTVPESRAAVECQFRDPEPAAEIAAFWREACTPGVLFDVGANNGVFSLLYCLAHPQNQAVGFEPSPVLGDRATQNAHLNGVAGRHTVVCKAVAEASGRRQMHMSDSDGYTQIEQFKGTGGDSWHGGMVDVTTLDVAAAEFLQPTLVKIDVEGYEREVLQGATALLERVRPVVFLELHLNFLEERGVGAIAVLDLLTAHGYELFRLSGRRISAHSAARTWASVLHLIARPHSVGGQGLSV